MARRAPIETIEHQIEQLGEVEVREPVLDLRLGLPAKKRAEDEKNLHLLRSRVEFPRRGTSDCRIALPVRRSGDAFKRTREAATGVAAASGVARTTEERALGGRARWGGRGDSGADSRSRVVVCLTARCDGCAPKRCC